MPVGTEIIRERGKNVYGAFADRNYHCSDCDCTLYPGFNSVYTQSDPEGTERNPEQDGYQKLQGPGAIQREEMG